MTEGVGLGQGLRGQDGGALCTMPPTGRASTASTCRPARKPNCRAIQRLRNSRRLTQSPKLTPGAIDSPPSFSRTGRLGIKPLLPGISLSSASMGCDRGELGRTSCFTLATGSRRQTAQRFQIAWKLPDSRWNESEAFRVAPRIAFPRHDRNSPSPTKPTTRSSAFSLRTALGAGIRNRTYFKKRTECQRTGSLFFTVFQFFMSGPGERRRSSLLRRVPRQTSSRNSLSSTSATAAGANGGVTPKWHSGILRPRRVRLGLTASPALQGQRGYPAPTSV